MPVGQNTSLVNVEPPCFCCEDIKLPSVDEDSLKVAKRLCELRTKGIKVKKYPVTKDEEEYKRLYDRLEKRKNRGTLGPIAEQCCNGRDCHSFHNGTVYNQYVEEYNLAKSVTIPETLPVVSSTEATSITSSSQTTSNVSLATSNEMSPIVQPSPVILNNGNSPVLSVDQISPNKDTYNRSVLPVMVNTSQNELVLPVLSNNTTNNESNPVLPILSDNTMYNQSTPVLPVLTNNESSPALPILSNNTMYDRSTPVLPILSDNIMYNESTPVLPILSDNIMYNESSPVLPILPNNIMYNESTPVLPVLTNNESGPVLPILPNNTTNNQSGPVLPILSNTMYNQSTPVLPVLPGNNMYNQGAPILTNNSTRNQKTAISPVLANGGSRPITRSDYLLTPAYNKKAKSSKKNIKLAEKRVKIPERVIIPPGMTEADYLNQLKMGPQNKNTIREQKILNKHLADQLAILDEKPCKYTREEKKILSKYLPTSSNKRHKNVVVSDSESDDEDLYD